LRARDHIWGHDFGLGDLEIDQDKEESLIEKMVEQYIELAENEVLVTHNWNLNLGSGEEVLS
jgi:hypothetical protein